MSSSTARRLFWLVGLMTAVKIGLAVALPLLHDEAYYWIWSRRLDWSYLEHPPLIAYLVALGTRGGDDSFWIRLPALVLGVGTAYALYLLGREMFDERVGLLAVVVYQAAPVLVASGLMATPDAPMFLGWTLAMRYVWQALHGRPDRWIAAGAALGFGLLGKLYTVFLGIGVFIYLVVCARPWLRRRGPYIAAAIALIMLSPVIYWNIVHDWAGVRFQVQERLHEEGEPGNMPGPGAGTRLAEQHLSLVLILFPAFAWGLWVAWRRRGDERFAYLLCTSVPALVMPLLVAPVGAARGHLMAPAYIGLAVALGALWNRPVAWLAAGNAVVLLLFVAAVLAPALLPIPGAREYYGWREAGARAMQEVAALGPATKAVIVADRYQIAAQMTYYTRDAVPVLFMPHANPASVWPSVDRYRGATAVAVTYAPDGFEWRGCFSRVEHRPTVTVRHGSRTVQEFYVFRLSGLSLPCPRR